MHCDMRFTCLRFACIVQPRQARVRTHTQCMPCHTARSLVDHQRVQRARTNNHVKQTFLQRLDRARAFIRQLFHHLHYRQR